MSSSKCAYCGEEMVQNGWLDLCQRQCFYGLRELLVAYNSGPDEIPDPRIISYFTKNPESGHSFGDEKKILAFVAANKVLTE